MEDKSVNVSTRRPSRPGLAPSVYRLIRPTAVVALSLGGVVLSGHGAFAYNLLPYSWDHTAVTYAIRDTTRDYGNYTFPTGLKSDVATAASNWSGGPASLAINPGNQYTDISIGAWSNSNTGVLGLGGCWMATSTNRCINGNSGSQTWGSGEVELNWANLGQGGSAFHLDTILQEMGHSVGLDHSCVDRVSMSGPQQKCPNHPYGACNHDGSGVCITYPQQDDWSGLGSLYGYHPDGGGCAPVQVPPPSLTPTPDTNSTINHLSVAGRYPVLPPSPLPDLGGVTGLVVGTSNLIYDDATGILNQAPTDPNTATADVERTASKATNPAGLPAPTLPRSIPVGDHEC